MILNEAVYTKIMGQIPQLIELGDILSDEKLAEYYQLFRKKFGPEILSSLDGEALLSTMHDSGNHDSLVYWLEFKNDDELPNRFGGIGGGSALKFGIYRRGETGIWTTGSPHKQVQLSISEAIQIARQHRDQLLAGVRELDLLPENASNEDYLRLQKKWKKWLLKSAILLGVINIFICYFPTNLEFFITPTFSDFICSNYCNFHFQQKGDIP